MQDIHQNLIEMTQAAKILHAKERRITLQSIDLVGRLEQRKAWYALGMTVETYVTHIGLTASKYWKRVKVARLLQDFPEAREIFERGETDVSHLALVAGKITTENSKILLEGIRGKSKREVEEFISRVNHKGEISAKEGTFDVLLRLLKSEFALLERSREVLSHGGHVPTNGEIVTEALNCLLEKKDPIRKAERSAKRKGNEGLAMKEEPKAEELSLARTIPADEGGRSGKSIARKQKMRTARPALSSATKNAVWIRDEGRCTFQNPDGSQCNARMMLEIDHKTMYCRGGDNHPDNLTLRCRYHNNLLAALQLGQGFMDEMKYSS